MFRGEALALGRPASGVASGQWPVTSEEGDAQVFRPESPDHWPLATGHSPERTGRKLAAECKGRRRSPPRYKSRQILNRGPSARAENRVPAGGGPPGRVPAD